MTKMMTTDLAKKNRSIFLGFAFLLGLCIFLYPTNAAAFQQSSQIQNPKMEEASQQGTPSSWILMNPQEGKWSLDQKDPKEGKQSLQINGKDISSSGFTGIVQVLDGKPWRNKTICFKAFVKTDGSEDTSGGLWLRVDRDNGQTGAFDNMQDRPIKSKEWKEYQIVKKIDADAKEIRIGLIAKGNGKVWIDDCSFQETDLKPSESKKAVTQKIPEETNQKKEKFLNARSAYQNGHLAPQQPFLSPWLLLAGLVFGLFCVAQIPAGVPQARDLTLEKSPSTAGHHFLVKFAFRFSFCYWLLFSLPQPLTGLIPYVGGYLYSFRSWFDDTVVLFLAENVFGLTEPLVSPRQNGSGDSTYSYLRVFSIFSFSAIIGTIWSLIDRRKTNNASMRDLLTSFVRYNLALTMLGYGLAKVAWDSNQFSGLSEHQLNSTWGSCSPMGILWRTMGYSRAYSVFGGAGEVVGALLLIFRRTSLLGALVTIGVMTNVVMMNLCFDVPVKLYSAHYLVMAIFLVLPHTSRLMNLMVFNRRAEPTDFTPPFTGPVTIWFHRAVKAAVIIMLFAIPISYHSYRQVTYLTTPAHPFMGIYEVAEVKDQEASAKEKPTEKEPAVSSNSADPWKSVSFVKSYYPTSTGYKQGTFIRIKTVSGKAASSRLIEESMEHLELAKENLSPLLPKKPFTLTKVEESDDFELTFEQNGVSKTIRLSPKRYLLTDRGFRWINETPFNR